MAHFWASMVEAVMVLQQTYVGTKKQSPYDSSFVGAREPRPSPTLRLADRPPYSTLLDAARGHTQFERQQRRRTRSPTVGSRRVDEQ